MPEPRVVSLLASATEIMCALGAERWLVGISHECDYPEHVLNRPRCSRSKVSSDLESADSNRHVQATCDSGESLYGIDVDRLVGLAPTVILTQVQCEVCAVSPRDLEGITFERLDAPPQIVALNTQCLADLYVDILRVARALRLEDRAFQLNDALRSRLNTLRERTKSFPKKSVACLDWLDPLMIAGHWMPELAEAAGGRAVLTNDLGRSQIVSPDELCAADPDVIVCMPCGFTVDRTLHDVDLLMRNEKWRALKAVRTGRAYVVDGNAFFNRSGPRLIDSAELLAQLLHPAVFDFPNLDGAYAPISAIPHNPS